MLGTTPGRQDDLLCANQKLAEAFVSLRSQWVDHSSKDSGGCGARMLDPSSVEPGRAGSRFWFLVGRLSMIEFWFSCLPLSLVAGGLYIALLFLPKALPFVEDWGSRLGAFLDGWRAEVARMREQGRLERVRRCRHRNHLRSGWDWNWLVASVCVFLFGAFLILVGDSVQRGLNKAAQRSNYMFPMEYGGWEIASLLEWHGKFDKSGVMVEVGFWIAQPSLLGVLVFGLVFCCRYFSAEARYRRMVDREERLDAERRRRREDNE